MFKYNNIEDAMDNVIATVDSRYQFIVNQRIGPFSNEISLLESQMNKIVIPSSTLAGAF